MNTFTASEVRDQAEWLSGVSVIGTGKTCHMLLAYADRLEADEKAQAQPQSGEWTMAPREPTNTMMVAASRMAFAANVSVSLNFICAIYQTMLAVAPQPLAAEPVAWMHPELHRGHPYPEECLTTEAIDGWLPLYTHSAKAQAQPPARTCSDERPCVNCYSGQGECLGPAPETVRQRKEQRTVEIASAISTRPAFSRYESPLILDIVKAALAAQESGR